MKTPRAISPWYHLLYLTPEPTIEEVVEAVCLEYGITSDELMLNTHLHRVSRPRHLVIALVTKLNTKIRQKDLAQYFSYHHSTVIHALESVESQYGLYPAYRKTYDKLASALLRGEFKHCSNTVQE